MVINSTEYLFASDKMPISIPDTEENVRLCTCPDCPTYKDSKLTGTLFCSRGKAKEKVKSTSCICPPCPVAVKYGLKQTYYCVSGKAEA